MFRKLKVNVCFGQWRNIITIIVLITSVYQPLQELLSSEFECVE